MQADGHHALHAALQKVQRRRSQQGVQLLLGSGKLVPGQAGQHGGGLAAFHHQQRDQIAAQTHYADDHRLDAAVAHAVGKAGHDIRVLFAQNSQADQPSGFLKKARRQRGVDGEQERHLL